MEHPAAVHLTTKTLERTVNRFIPSYFNTYGQNESLLGDFVLNLLFDQDTVILNSLMSNRRGA